MEPVSVQFAILAVARNTTASVPDEIDAATHHATAAGHKVVSDEIIADSEPAIRARLTELFANPEIDVVLVLAGAESDAASKALKPLVTEVLPGFTDLFRWLMFQEAGASAMLSSAEAAQCGSTFVFVLPGAIAPAMEKLIIPQFDPNTTPRNLVEKLPRLRTEPLQAVPQVIAVEKTQGGSGIHTRLPAIPSGRLRSRTGANVIHREFPTNDATKPIDLEKLEQDLAASTPHELPNDDATRPIDLGLPTLPPGADPDAYAPDSDDDHTDVTLAAPPPPVLFPRPQMSIPSIAKPPPRANPTGARGISPSTPPRIANPSSSPVRRDAALTPATPMPVTITPRRKAEPSKGADPAKPLDAKTQTIEAQRAKDASASAEARKRALTPKPISVTPRANEWEQQAASTASKRESGRHAAITAPDASVAAPVKTAEAKYGERAASPVVAAIAGTAKPRRDETDEQVTQRDVASDAAHDFDGRPTIRVPGGAAAADARPTARVPGDAATTDGRPTARVLGDAAAADGRPTVRTPADAAHDFDGRPTVRVPGGAAAADGPSTVRGAAAADGHPTVRVPGEAAAADGPATVRRDSATADEAPTAVRRDSLTAADLAEPDGLTVRRPSERAVPTPAASADEGRKRSEPSKPPKHEPDSPTVRRIGSDSPEASADEGRKRREPSKPPKNEPPLAHINGAAVHEASDLDAAETVDGMKALGNSTEALEKIDQEDLIDAPDDASPAEIRSVLMKDVPPPVKPALVKPAPAKPTSPNDAAKPAPAKPALANDAAKSVPKDAAPAKPARPITEPPPAPAAKPARPITEPPPPPAAKRSPTTPPPARASVDELPRGNFAYPVKKRGMGLAMKLLLAAVILGAGFFAVVFLFRDKEPSAAKPAEPPVASNPTPPPEPAPVITPDAAIEEPDIEMDPVPTKPIAEPKQKTEPRQKTEPKQKIEPKQKTEPKTEVTPTTPPPDAAVAVVDDDCDETSCVLSKYERACCAKYKPATTDFQPRVGDVPESLDKTMVRAGVERVKPRVVACGEKAAVKGTVRIALAVSPEGAVTSSSVSDSPDPALGECVANAMKNAKFGKTVNGASFTYPFSF